MPSESDLQFDVLLEAFHRYAEAKGDHDRAYAKYDGQSWGWSGHYVIEAMSDARAECKSQFTAFVAEAVRVALKEQNT